MYAIQFDVKQVSVCKVLLMFDIPLLGEGAGSVEAFPSYLHRCAYHHGVSTSKFLEYLHQIINKGGTASIVSRKPSQLVTLSSLVTESFYTNIYIRTIIKLSGRNLVDSTFIKLQSIVTRPNNEIVRCMRWCPECFMELRQQKSEPYIKLVWFLSDISHCNIHRTRLLDTCPHCDKHQNTIGRSVPLDLCVFCNNDLKERSKEIIDDIIPRWIHQGEDLTRLIGRIVHDKSNFDEYYGIDGNSNYFWVPNKYRKGCAENSFYKDGIIKSFKDFSIVCREPEFSDTYDYCFRKKEIRNQLLFKDNLSLKTLRRFAFLSNCDIHDIITGNLVSKSINLPFMRGQNFPEDLRRPKAKKCHNHKANQEKLYSLIECDSPISLKEASRRSGLSSGYIAYRFPGLAREIVSRYQSHLDKIRMEKHQIASYESRRYFNSDECPDNKKTIKQALKNLMKKTSISKDYLKPAIKEAFEAYKKRRDL